MDRPDANKTMLRLSDVYTKYGQIEALSGVSVHINRGEIVCLIGANGAGKSTLLMTICGDPAPSSGTVELEGKDVTGKKPAEIMRGDIAIVPEGRRIFPAMTIEENLHMGGYFLSTEETHRLVASVYKHFPRLLERKQQRAGTLSGGEQQMLAIGRAMMSKPRLLLLDEPSLGLAPIIIQKIFEIIQQLRDEGITIFLVEQNANQALKISDRGYVLENGRIVTHDTGRNLLGNDAVKNAYLGIGENR